MKKFICGLVVICGVWLSYVFGWENDVRIAFDSQSNTAISYQVFYTTEPDTQFSERQSVKKQVSAGTRHVNIWLPADHIERIRLDIGSKPGKVTLKNITLSDFDGMSIDRFVPNDQIQEFNILDNTIVLSSTNKDPYIIYQGGVDANGIAHILFERLLWIFMGCAWLCWVITNMKKEDYYDNVDKKIHTLGFLRLLFSLSVVCTHFFAALHINKSGGSVEFFFILSGYFLALTYKPTITCVQYTKKKFIQLVPLVVFGSILCGGGFDSFSGMFFLQNTGLAFKSLANAPAWYVAVLFWVALFYLMILKCVQDKDKRNLLIGVIVFISCVICAQLPGDRWEMAFNFFPRALFRGLSCVGLGILAQQVIKREDVAPTMKYTILECVTLFIVVALLFTQIPIMRYWIWRPIRYIILVALFISCRGHLSRWMSKPIFSKMARYSLAIYLTHFFITSKPYGTMWLIEKYNPEWLIDEKGLVIFLVLCSSVLLGILSYYLVEKPATKLLKKHLN